MILRTLGGLTLEGAEFRRPKPLLVLVYLAVEGSTERRYLAELFWPRAANARRSLTTALTQIRTGVPDAIGADEVRVWCNMESDAMQLLRAVEDRDWLRAVELFRGPFLEGVDLGTEGVELEEWTYATRERVAHGMRTAFLALGEQAASDNRFDDAGTWAGRAHALSETAPAEPRDLGRLYRLLLATNRPHLGDVRREAEALGLDLPSTVAEARSSVRADASTAATRHLPVPATDFIGRRDELEMLTHLVTEDRSRLLSLVGPGGTGKTRLALELAQRQYGAGTWRGVHFVPLETTTDAEQVGPAVADALGVRLHDDGDVIAQLQQAIRDSAHLIVLDNFEHLMPAAPLLSVLVQACPNIQLVVTSREALGLVMERPILLGGLAVPGESHTSAEDVLHWDAVALFVQRAIRVRPDFTLRGAPIADVLRICRRVGGIPLAIEMAAAWVRAMTCTEIAEELDESLHLLQSHSRDRPDRHQSMRAVFEQSWTLLTPEERQVGEQLVVFQGGFDRQAAAKAVGASISRLAALVDRSLLTWNGSGRYQLHPLLRQFLEETARIEPKRSLDTLEQHARYYLGRLGILQATFPHRDSAKADAEIESDLLNFMAAWEWAAREGRCELLEPAIHSLGWFFFVRGRPNEGLDWSELKVFGDTSVLLELRQCLWQAVFANVLGRWSTALERINRSACLAERIGATSDHAFALRVSGIINLRRAPFDAARVASDFRRAGALYEDLGDIEGQAMMLNNHALLTEDVTQAREMLERARHIARDAGETHALAMSSGSLAGLLAFRDGDYLGARKAAEESVACHQAAGASLMMAHACAKLGAVLVMLGEVDGAGALAERLLVQADDLHTGAANEARGIASALFGTLQRILGNPDSAIDRFCEALHLLQSASRKDAAASGIAVSMNGLTRVALDAGRPQEARRYADRAIEFLTQGGESDVHESTGEGLIAHMHLGEALALQGLPEAAELQLQKTLRRASKERCIPAVLALLLALTELRRQQDPRSRASDVVASIAKHPASPFELARRAGTVLTGLSAAGFPRQIRAIGLDDAVTLMTNDSLDFDS